MKSKRWFERLLKFFGLIIYRNRTVHKHHTRTIKRPEKDCCNYQDKDIKEILRLKKLGKTDKQIGAILKRTEGAIRTARWRLRNSMN